MSRGGRKYTRVALACISIQIVACTVTAPAAAADSAHFPMGVYDKAQIEPGSDAWRAYYARLFDLLQRSDIDTLLTLPYKDASQTLSILDQARARGIHIIMSTGNPQNKNWDFAGPGFPFDRAYRHPSVIAYKYGDEPKDAATLAILESEYDTLRRYYRLPVVTALAGEGMDFGGADFALSMWDALHSEIRFARHYPIRRTYDLVNWYPDKMKMPFAAWTQKMESARPTPWWYIAQTFGAGLEKGQAAYWRYPTAAELSAMIHVALAHGARGIVGYALQDHEGFLGLVDANLAPHRARDGSTPLEEYGVLARLVHVHEALLLRHVPLEMTVSASKPEILVASRRDPATSARYVYVVNQDAEKAVAFDLTFPASPAVAALRDVYGNAALTIQRNPSQSAFHLTLEPGAGGLLEIDAGIPKPPVIETVSH